MRTISLAAVGAILACLLVAGCGGAESSSVPFTPTDTSQLDQMKDSMTKNLKTKNYVDQTAK